MWISHNQIRPKNTYLGQDLGKGLVQQTCSNRKQYKNNANMIHPVAFKSRGRVCSKGNWQWSQK